MTELKSCPFCGDDDVRIVKDMKDTNTPVYAVVCDECGGIFYTGDMLDMQSVIKAWNTRPNPWQTGTPTEEGLYLIAIPFLTDGIGKKIYRYETDYFNKAGKWRMFTNEVVAYQKITPYEGEVTNG